MELAKCPLGQCQLWAELGRRRDVHLPASTVPDLCHWLHCLLHTRRELEQANHSLGSSLPLHSHVGSRFHSLSLAPKCHPYKAITMHEL